MHLSSVDSIFLLSTCCKSSFKVLSEDKNASAFESTTGVEEFTLTEMMVNDEKLEVAKKGDSCTIPTKFRIRNSDKLYKIVPLMHIPVSQIAIHF